MGEFVRLHAADGHELGAYVARPEGEPIAGLVVIQEIFGVNRHIRSMTDQYAEAGFLAVAPALFDRVERGVELGYDGEDRQKAMSFMPKLDVESMNLDTDAAVAYARAQTGKKTGIVGYCLGGSIAWFAAMRGTVDAAVGYYGGLIAKFAEAELKAPVILHFGSKDTHIPEEHRAKIAAAHPEVPIYLYDAEHGFNCDQKSSFEPRSAALARERSLAFLRDHLG
ncbi:dienelactone hydrolase family protein [Silvibacterium dinghuense]|uniref:Dienelactone hydrolase family protein n=1 Tax=Silvibacterium dinghuense TaxID=1560006 RepID=A0A4Q1S7Y0_9BACT|nr:dienelactone hydrolase family protein [Silvibacterium dinghuense]RXS93056.1 dienelactone hydrolase family protein [Silvibacterium dinghuense]GGG89785.1 carboxymethylenebutenolidase [Silvibacterium dinghuense]